MWQQNPYHHSIAPKTGILEMIIDIVFETVLERKCAISSRILECNSLTR